MADDVLDIIVRLTGDYGALQELLHTPKNFNIGVVEQKATQNATGSAQAIAGFPAPGSGIPLSPAQQNQVQEAKKYSRELEVILNLKRQIFREDQKEQEANRKHRQEPLFGRTKEQIAYESGIDPKFITEQRKLFELSRIANRQNLREIGLATLFGQGIGGKLGGGVGALVGAGFGAGGGLLGATIAQTAIQEFREVFDLISRGLEKVTQAGISFERSILGIASVLQATTEIKGPSGQPLSIPQQLEAQQQRAKDIQQAARKKLLPLGISGEKEATLVQAIISGAAQRGIQLSPDQASTLAERLGGAIQAQRPEILDNPTLLRRDVEDALAGTAAGKRSIVGSIIRGFAPGIFTAGSGNDLVTKSEGLKEFPISIKNSNNPVVVINQLDSALDQLATTVGRAFIEDLVPAIKDLTAALSDEALGANVENFTHQIANLADVLVRSGTQILDLSQAFNLPEGSGDRDFTKIALRVAGRQAGLSPEALKVLDAFTEILIPTAGSKKKEEKKEPLNARQRAETFLNSFEGTLGNLEEVRGQYDNKNPFAQLDSIREITERLPILISQFGIFSDKIKNVIDNLASQKADVREGLFNKAEGLFGKDIFSRQLGNEFALSNNEDILGARQGVFNTSKDRYAQAQQRFARAQQNYQNLVNTPGGREGLAFPELREAEKELSNTRKQLYDDTVKLIEAENKHAQLIQQGIDLEKEQASRRLQTIDTFTAQGQEQGILSQQTGLDAVTAKIVAALQDPNITAQQRQDLQQQLQAQGPQQAGILRAAQLQPGSVAGDKVNLTRALDELANSSFDAAKAAKEMADAVRDAGLALEDFDRETNLRDLERTDKVAADKERFADALDKQFGKGYGDYLRENPDAKAQRETQIASERYFNDSQELDPFRTHEDDRRKREQLELNKTDLGNKSRELQFNQASQKLGLIQKVIELAQRFPDNPDLQDAAKQAQSQINSTLGGLGFGAAGLSPRSPVDMTVGEAGFDTNTYTNQQVKNPNNYKSPFGPAGDIDQLGQIKGLINTADFEVNNAIININSGDVNYNPGQAPTPTGGSFPMGVPGSPLPPGIGGPTPATYPRLPNWWEAPTPGNKPTPGDWFGGLGSGNFVPSGPAPQPAPIQPPRPSDLRYSPKSGYGDLSNMKPEDILKMSDSMFRPQVDDYTNTSGYGGVSPNMFSFSEAPGSDWFKDQENFYGRAEVLKRRAAYAKKYTDKYISDRTPGTEGTGPNSLTRYLNKGAEGNKLFGDYTSKETPSLDILKGMYGGSSGLENFPFMFDDKPVDIPTADVDTGNVPGFKYNYKPVASSGYDDNPRAGLEIDPDSKAHGLIRDALLSLGVNPKDYPQYLGENPQDKAISQLRDPSNFETVPKFDYPFLPQLDPNKAGDGIVLPESGSVILPDLTLPITAAGKASLAGSSYGHPNRQSLAEDLLTAVTDSKSTAYTSDPNYNPFTDEDLPPGSALTKAEKEQLAKSRVKYSIPGTIPASPVTSLPVFGAGRANLPSGDISVPITEPDPHYQETLHGFARFDQENKQKREQEFVSQFEKQTPSNQASSATDIVNTLKELPAQIGLQTRYAIENSFGSS